MMTSNRPQCVAQDAAAKPFAGALPRIETIDDIKDACTRRMLVGVMTRYLEASAYTAGCGMEERNFLDEVTSMLDIRHVSMLCEGIGFKESARNGIAMLTGVGDTDLHLEMEYLDHLVESSPRMGKKLGGHLLDIGSSVGALTHETRRTYGAESVGVDIDRNAIKLGKFLGVKGLVAIEENDYALPFNDERFDAVLMRSVLNCPQADEIVVNAMIREAARVVKRDGIIIISGYTDSDDAELRRVGLVMSTSSSRLWTVWTRGDRSCAPA
ncbi:Ubiquinone/menaquinone biosynthesis C-methyltransferase UbiE [uncultured archaeon]|nr:Ubiquinone/menaquinone biosynthesis C-methyltransferase UbiE [uncultured archaeon]